MRTIYVFAGTDATLAPSVPASRQAGQAVAAASPSVRLNPVRDVTEIGVALIVLSGAPVVTLYATIDETGGPAAEFTEDTCFWFPVTGWIGVAASTGGTVGVLTPIRAVKAVVTSGVGAVRLGVLQSGSAG